MKRFFVSSIITGLLLGLGTAAAQPATHGVDILIPNVLMLRLVDGGNASVIDPMVVFNFQTETGIVSYLAAIGGAGILAPTSSNFSDVIVFSNRGSWSVSVAATALDFDDNLDGGFVEGGLVVSDISVERPDPSQLASNVTSVSSSWSLATAASTIAGGQRTEGWRSLGFGGADYRLSVDGDESPGLYWTTVTYTITAP